MDLASGGVAREPTDDSSELTKSESAYCPLWILSTIINSNPSLPKVVKWKSDGARKTESQS